MFDPKSLIESLDRRIKFHQGNENDSHNISNAVICALVEVRQAVEYASEQPAPSAPPLPEPPQDEDEKAFSEWFDKEQVPWTNDLKANCFGVWKAGREFERSKR